MPLSADSGVFASQLSDGNSAHRATCSLSIVAVGAVSKRWGSLEACRALSLTPTLLKAYGAEGMTHRDAWVAQGAYLAAFAIAGGLRMVTLDRDFTAYLPHGLELSLLSV